MKKIYLLFFLSIIVSCSDNENNQPTSNDQFILSNGTVSVNMIGSKWINTSQFIINVDSTVTDTTSSDLRIFEFIDGQNVKVSGVVNNDTIIDGVYNYTYQNDSLFIPSPGDDYNTKIELVNDTTFQLYQIFSPSGILVSVFFRFH